MAMKEESRLESFNPAVLNQFLIILDEEKEILKTLLRAVDKGTRLEEEQTGLTRELVKSSDQRTQLAERRTDLSLQRLDLDTQLVGHAEQRTRLAEKRNSLAELAGLRNEYSLVFLLNFPVHIATATSHFILANMALTGTLTHILTGTFSHGIHRTVYLAMGVMVGAQLGARLSNRIKGPWIIKSLALALGFVGIRILLQAASGYVG
jgi:hypothetical protein